MSEILLVDDERTLREGLRSLLASEGYDVRTARDGEDAVRKFLEKRPDLVLLDIMMPKKNGFMTCEDLRRRDALLPVVFLTAKDSEADQVRAMGLGADDYVSKDASEEILLSRIRRALLRSDAFARELSRRSELPIRLGRVSVDLRKLQVMVSDREIARLTKTEADLLKLLNAERGRVLSVDEIIAGLRGSGYACEDTLVYSQISRLRFKLGPAGGMVSCVRGAGYGLLK